LTDIVVPRARRFHARRVIASGTLVFEIAHVAVVRHVHVVVLSRRRADVGLIGPRLLLLPAAARRRLWPGLFARLIF
jgi:hypothetical protein